MAFSLRKFLQGIKLIPTASPISSSLGDMEALSSSNKVTVHNGTSASPIVTEAHTATITNKTIDGDDNTVQDLPITSIKTNLTDASKFMVRDASGVPTSSTKSVPSGVVVGTTDTQTLTNKSLDDTTTAIVDTSDPTKQIKFDAAGTTGTSTTLLSSQTTNKTLTLPNATDTLVGKATTDSLTNKTLVDTSTAIADSGDSTIQIKFDAAGTTGTSTTLLSSQTTNKTLTLPNATDTLVGKATTDILTNKTLSGNTATNLVNGSGTLNINSTGTITVPNATDTLVGKATTDSLTNKTMGDALSLTQIATPSSPSSGFNKIYSKSDDKLYVLNSAGTETAVGTGSGAFNYITNNDAESSTTGWATYADAAGTRPVDGTGGSPSSTFTRSTSSPLAGTGSFLWTKSANNRQGEGFSYDFTLRDCDKQKLMTIQFDYQISSGTFVGSQSVATNSDLIVYLYDITAGALVEPAPYLLDGTSSTSNFYRYKGSFQTSNSSQYRLIVHTATTSASAYTVKFDNFTVSSGEYVVGAIGSDSTAYTPTTTGWGTPTSVGIYYSRINDFIFIRGSLVLGTTTATDATVALPTGLSIDSSKMSTNSVGTKTGIFNVAPRGGGSLSYLGNYSGITFYNGSDTAKIYFGKETGTTAISKLQGNDYSSGQTISFDIMVPVLGWSSGMNLSVDGDNRLVAARYFDLGTGSVATTLASSTTAYVTKDYDTHNAFSSGTYTIPVSGYYRISAADIITATFSAGDATAIAIFKNGTSHAQSQNRVTASSSNNEYGKVTDTLFCNAGDTITIRHSCGATSPTFVTNNSGNFFAIERVMGNLMASPNDKVYARYKSSAGQSIPSSGTDTIIDFATKDFDSHSAVTTGASWKFTAPVAGIYNVSSVVGYGFLSYSGSGFGEFLALYKNGSIANYLDLQENQTAATTGPYLSGSSLIQLNAGDFIDIRTHHDESGSRALQSSTNHVHVSINKVN